MAYLLAILVPLMVYVLSAAYMVRKINQYRRTIWLDKPEASDLYYCYSPFINTVIACYEFGKTISTYIYKKLNTPKFEEIYNFMMFRGDK